MSVGLLAGSFMWMLYYLVQIMHTDIKSHTALTPEQLNNSTQTISYIKEIHLSQGRDKYLRTSPNLVLVCCFTVIFDMGHI